MARDEETDEKTLARLRLLTIVYILLIAGVIFIAGWRGTGYLLSFVGYVPYGDKIGHFVLMGGLSLLVNLSLRARSVSLGRLRYLLGSLIVGAFVLLEEISQIFIRLRTFDWGDLAFDLAGIIVFGEAARAFWRRSGRNRLVEKR